MVTWLGVMASIHTRESWSSTPNNVSELITILGMFQYLVKLVYDMSSVMKPMTDLLKSDVVWSWDKAQQASFDKTKERLTTTPTLSYYDSKLRNRCCAGAICWWNPQVNRLRVKDVDDRGTTVRPNRKGDACRCLGVREIPKISRWIEGIQTTYRP